MPRFGSAYSGTRASPGREAPGPHPVRMAAPPRMRKRRREERAVRICPLSTASDVLRTSGNAAVRKSRTRRRWTRSDAGGTGSLGRPRSSGYLGFGVVGFVVVDVQHAPQQFPQAQDIGRPPASFLAPTLRPRTAGTFVTSVHAGPRRPRRPVDPVRSEWTLPVDRPDVSRSRARPDLRGQPRAARIRRTGRRDLVGTRGA